MQKKVEHSTDVSHMNEPQSQRGAASIAGRVFRVFWKGFWSIMLIGLITGIIVGIAMLGYVLSLRDSRADINLKTFQQPQTSYVYKQDAEGNWAETTQLRGERNTKMCIRDRSRFLQVYANCAADLLLFFVLKYLPS